MMLLSSIATTAVTLYEEQETRGFYFILLLIIPLVENISQCFCHITLHSTKSLSFFATDIPNQSILPTPTLINSLIKYSALIVVSNSLTSVRWPMLNIKKPVFRLINTDSKV